MKKYLVSGSVAGKSATARSDDPYRAMAAVARKLGCTGVSPGNVTGTGVGHAIYRRDKYGCRTTGVQITEWEVTE